jgi:hypothetical protein
MSLSLSLGLAVFSCESSKDSGNADFGSGQTGGLTTSAGSGDSGGSGPGVTSLSTSSSTTAGSPCPNGVIDANEECDGTNLGDATDCASLGMGSGTLSCLSNCMYDVSMCMGGGTTMGTGG